MAKDQVDHVETLEQHVCVCPYNCNPLIAMPLCVEALLLKINLNPRKKGLGLGIVGSGRMQGGGERRFRLQPIDGQKERDEKKLQLESDSSSDEAHQDLARQHRVKPP